MIFGGLLPGLAGRAIIRRDLKHYRPLLRDGVAYAAKVLQHTRLTYGGMHQLALCWQEPSGEATARFDLSIDLERPLEKGDEVTMLVLPSSDMVGAVFERDALTLGRRTRA